MTVKQSIAKRVARVTPPLVQALRASEELMAPRLDTGSKGIRVRPPTSPASGTKAHF
jgi:hypothetical protein